MPIFASTYLHKMKTRRDVFQAIADPTRREIIDMIARQPLNLNSIAENFNVSRQAVSLHIKILEECGLIVIRQQGRERHCEPRLAKLREVATWVDDHKTFWTNKLNDLGNFLDESTNPSRPKQRSLKRKHK